jgi:hypothetical protein
VVIAAVVLPQFFSEAVITQTTIQNGGGNG